MKFRQFLDTCLDGDTKEQGKLGGFAKKKAPDGAPASPFAGDMGEKKPAEEKKVDVPAQPKEDTPPKEEKKEEPKEEKKPKDDDKEEAPEKKEEPKSDDKPDDKKKGGLGKKVEESFSLMTLLLNEAAEKTWCIVDCTIDYDVNGRDKNKNFEISVDCKTEEAALALHAKLDKLNDEGDVKFSDDCSFDASDILSAGVSSASGADVMSYDLTQGKGPSLKPTARSYKTTLDQFKIEAE